MVKSEAMLTPRLSSLSMSSSLSSSLSTSVFTFLGILVILVMVTSIQAQPSNCWSQRANLGENDFVPECTENGNYKPVQCDKETGYCFCVNEITGRPISKSSTRNKNPNCRKYANYPWKTKQTRRRGTRCTVAQRFFFIRELVRLLRRKTSTANTANYPLGIPLGMRKPVPMESEPSQTYLTIKRKFNELDRNADSTLTQEEMRPLVEFASSHFQQVGCANSLFDFCDSSADQRVTQMELIYCLDQQNTQSLDEALRARKAQSQIRKHSTRPQITRSDHFQSSPPTSLDSMLSSDDSSAASSLDSRLILKESSRLPNKSSSDAKQPRLDCLVTRANLLESARQNPHSPYFIPECTPDGYYVSFQCHLLHCWCLNRVTGQPLKTVNNTGGNSAANGKVCESWPGGRKSRGTESNSCDQRRRAKYHDQLRSYLSRARLTCESAFDSHVLDSNSDRRIDWAEWKRFKKTWAKQFSKRLRKCFRNEIWYCDQNGDRVLTREEWLACCRDNVTTHKIRVEPSQLSIAQLAMLSSGGGGRVGSLTAQQFADLVAEKRSRVRNGPNPLRILKSEK